MTAQYLTIEAKHRQMVGFQASLADFTVTAGDAVDADIVRARPNISLYCLDNVAKRAIFAELPADIDLAQAPFVYQTQYEQAQRLIALPYDTFQQLASTLPAVKHLIMVYITGRSGSTLLSHLFNELESVLSLAEPDVATSFVHLRSADGARDAELRVLLDSTVRFLFKPTAHKTPATFALKLRNEATQIMDLFQATFPQAKNLFLYRDTIGFVQSFYRIFKREEFSEYTPLSEYAALFRLMFNADFTHLEAYLDAGTTDLSTPQLLTLWWLAAMEWYLAKYDQGLPIMAVRYDDLNTNREQIVSAIFAYCGLPTTAVHSALSAFARDAQAGTILARENPQQGNSFRLSDAQRDEVTRILRRHPRIKQSDFIAPGTLRV